MTASKTASNAAKASSITVVLGFALTAAACGGKARGPESYRADTQQLLDLRAAQIKSCYDEALAANATLAGTVRVTFVVEKKTGEITKAEIDPASNAPEPLGACVLQGLQGLKLDPPDKNEGQATFEYAFSPTPAT